MDAPLYSVIIPVHNAQDTIEDTIRSLQQQTLDEWEALIVDDASTDQSTELIKVMCSLDPRLNLFHNTDQGNPLGVASARNKGIQNAKGRYIAFLDADDLWYRDKLARQHSVFASGADIVFSAYKRVNTSGYDLGTVPAREKLTWKDALSGNPIGCLTGAYRRERFENARMPDLDLHEDYAFWLGLLSTGAEAIGVQEVLAEYRIMPGSRSSNKLHSAAAVWKILQLQNISMGRRIGGFTVYALRAIWQRL